jgi:hypothetical protein
MDEKKLIALLPDVLDGKKFVVLMSGYNRASNAMGKIAEATSGFEFNWKRRIIKTATGKGFIRFIVAHSQNRAQLAGYEIDGYVFDDYEAAHTQEPERWHEELRMRCARSGGGEIR